MQRIGSANRRKFRQRVERVGGVVQALEARQLLSASVSNVIEPVLANTSSPSTNDIELSNFLGDATNLPGSGTVVTFTFAVDNTTLFGKSKEAQVQVGLTDAATPITVANFLRYVNNGLYDGTFLHRAVDIATSTGAGSSPSDPATIEQGGGYYVNDNNPAKPTISRIQTFGEITNESGSEAYENVAGTIAMALSADPSTNDVIANSATSEFYFNVSDNTSLDTDTTSDGTDETGYTVFGKVLGDGLTTLATLSDLPTSSINASLGLTQVPVTGISATQAIAAHPQIAAKNLVYIKSVTSQPGIVYTAASSDPSLVRPIVSGSTLSFAYGSTGGTAVITVNAAEYDGTTASESFTVTVPASGSTATGPVVAASTATAISNGSATTLFPLAGDSDSSAALNPATLNITAGPTDGVATVNATNGEIDYTPTAGFVGTDTISYTVEDESGTQSAAATITINVTAAPATVTIGTAGSRSLVLTQADGTVDTLSITGGTATITFAGPNVTLSNAGGNAIASGGDASISTIDINNTGRHRASLSVSGGAITLGEIVDAGIMNSIAGSSVTLGGVVNVQGLARLSVGATDGAVLDIGSGAGATALTIPTATDTTVNAGGTISTLRSAKWISDDGGAYAISATNIRTLLVSGEFDDALDLSGAPGDTIVNAKIGGPLGSSSGAAGAAAWTIGGSIGRLSAASVNASWSLSSSGTLGATNLGSAVSGAISAASILNLTVHGADSGAITATNTITQLHIDGADSGSLNAANVTSAVISGDESGAVNVTGTVHLLQVHGAVSGAITVDNLDTLTATGALSSTLSATGKIGSLSAAGVSGAVSSGAAITAMTVHGDLTGSVAAGSTLGTLTVTGNINGSTISTAGTFSARAIQLGRISAGEISNETISAVGNIGSINATSLIGSFVYAGINSADVAALSFPSATSDFTSDARIESVRLTGSANPAFSNSKISAQTMGALSLGIISTDNDGAAEGVAGETLTAVHGTLSGGGTLALGRLQLRTAAALSSYLSDKKITLGDFEINVIAAS